MPTYKARLDFVVYQFHKKALTKSGLAIPDRSLEGQECTVVSIGPKVENLKVGDKIQLLSTDRTMTTQIPDERDLFLTRDGNIALVVEGY